MDNIQQTQLHLCKRVLDNFPEAAFFVDNQLRILYWNKMAEQLSGYTAAEVLGRSCWNNILKHIDDHGNPMCATACPLVRAIAEGTKQETACMLHQKDGRRMNVLMKDTPIKDDNGNTIGAVQFFVETAAKSEAAKKELTKMDFVDKVTNLPNRKYGELRLAALVREISRGGLDCGVMLINIDNYKDLQTEFGSEVCEKLIKVSAKLLASGISSSDSLSRWAEDCFLVITDNTKKSLLMLAANKLQALLSKTLQLDGFVVNLQISVSATLPSRSDDLEKVYRKLERQLQKSRDSGQPQVMVDTAEDL